MEGRPLEWISELIGKGFGQKIVRRRNIPLFRILDSEPVGGFARYTQHLVLAVNIGPFERTDLLFAEPALQGEADCEVHVGTGSTQNACDLIAGEDDRQGLVVAGHGRNDLRKPDRHADRAVADRKTGEKHARPFEFERAGMSACFCWLRIPVSNQLIHLDRAGPA
jgi:hypothetical protein